MNAMDFDALPTEVESILSWWTPRVRDALGKNLKAVVLYGGTTLGEFCPGWSDVDACVVLCEPITSAEADAAAKLHDEMEKRFLRDGADGWRSGQVVEGAYIPAAMAADPSLKSPVFTSYGERRRRFTGRPISPFDRYMLAHFGRRLSGEATPFAPATRESLVEQTEEDVRSVETWDAGEGHSAIWLAGMLHWIARAVVFWRDGRMVSKSAALRREIDAGSPYADAFSLALDIREEGSAAAAGHLQELRRRFAETAGPAARGIRRVMRTGGRGCS
jgi:predicted nucleotidyltransferase